MAPGGRWVDKKRQLAFIQQLEQKRAASWSAPAERERRRRFRANENTACGGRFPRVRKRCRAALATAVQGTLARMADVRFPMPATLAFLVPQGQPEISQPQSGWAGGKIKIRPEGTVEHQTRIPTSFQDGQISRTLYQPLRSWLISGVAPRQNPCRNWKRSR